MTVKLEELAETLDEMKVEVSEQNRVGLALLVWNGDPVIASKIRVFMTISGVCGETAIMALIGNLADATLLSAAASFSAAWDFGLKDAVLDGLRFTQVPAMALWLGMTPERVTELLEELEESGIASCNRITH